MLFGALWSTQGELTRGISGIGSPIKTPSALTSDQALARSAASTRASQYVFEFLNALTFTAGVPNATLACAAVAGGGAAPASLIMAPPTYEPAAAPGSSTALLEAELQKVLDMAVLRRDRMSEILVQVKRPTAFYAMVLNLQPWRYRYTLELFATVFRLSTLVTMQFKHHFRVIRPGDRSVLVQPVLLNPGHWTYPAGHAAQSYFASAILTNLTATALPGPDVANQLDKLAARISDNRVVAGVHYPEDIAKGKALGQSLAVMLEYRATAATSALNWLFRQARSEWV